MARTTSILVQKVLLAAYDGKTDLTPFIETASALVDDVVDCAADKGVTLSASRLELIERWLAAHCYAMSDPTYEKKRTGNSDATFRGDTGMYLEATLFGQTAVGLDTSGCLRGTASSERKVASAFWLGKRPSEQTDYIHRD